MKASFVKRTDLSEAIASFSFRTSQPFSFTAGQFINLTLTGHVEDGQPAERWFTLSSSPNDDELTITTRLSSSPFKRALQKLAAGDAVDISDPLGDFVLPRLLQTPLVFVAGGIGITPFRSMLEWLAETGEDRPVRLLWSVKSEDDIIFQDTFDRAKQHASIVVENPTAAWGGERGKLTAEMIIGLEQPSADSLVYLSGPEPFVQSLQHDLRKAGISNQQIVVDEFQGYNGI